MTTLLTGERHSTVAAVHDRRIVLTACGLRLARGSYDPTSAYQQAGFPKMQHPIPCPRCAT